MDPLSLYVHIPFCQHRCAYCDFNTYTTVGTLQEQYVHAVERELDQLAILADKVGQRRSFHTLFFGGGTPSLLKLREIQQILESVQDTFGITPAAEITLEANPDTVDESYLKGLRQSGINRLSFGVQSAQADELALLERTHDFSTVVDVVAQARTAGFDNLSLDLIYGLPRQDLSSWVKSLEEVLKLEPEHLSLYCLTIERGTPMHRWLVDGRIPKPDADLAAEQYEFAGQKLAEYGYEHYEISNWAKPGRECRHNMTYWRNQEYLGLGAGAHGQANGYRYGLVKRPRVYVRRLDEEEGSIFPLSGAVAESHKIGRREAISDTVITQLRLLQEGLDLPAFTQRFGQSLEETYDGLPSQLMEWDLLAEADDRLLLTERGRFISNQVFYRFM